MSSLADSNYESAQLSKIAERMRYAKEKACLLEDVVNVPRNGEDATKCCNARTRSARRRRVIGRVLAEELHGELKEAVEMVDRNI